MHVDIYQIYALEKYILLHAHPTSNILQCLVRNMYDYIWFLHSVHKYTRLNMYV